MTYCVVQCKGNNTKRRVRSTVRGLDAGGVVKPTRLFHHLSAFIAQSYSVNKLKNKKLNRLLSHDSNVHLLQVVYFILFNNRPSVEQYLDVTSALAPFSPTYGRSVRVNISALKASGFKIFKCDSPCEGKCWLGNSNVFADAEHISWISHCKPAIVCLRVTD